ncbi:hypothetical protein PT974_03503 [Cladobotryum mycophilum]|uniref:Uncharacterized protein n=1 Tax=Cladobotryum mycophilum TaxID=491253 RepID=A0ABR0SSI3_9HYPO
MLPEDFIADDPDSTITLCRDRSLMQGFPMVAPFWVSLLLCSHYS